RGSQRAEEQTGGQEVLRASRTWVAHRAHDAQLSDDDTELVDHVPLPACFAARSSIPRAMTYAISRNTNATSSIHAVLCSVSITVRYTQVPRHDRVSAGSSR